MLPGPSETTHAVGVAIFPPDFDPLPPHVMRPGLSAATRVVGVAIFSPHFGKLALGQIRYSTPPPAPRCASWAVRETAAVAAAEYRSESRPESRRLSVTELCIDDDAVDKRPASFYLAISVLRAESAERERERERPTITNGRLISRASALVLRDRDISPPYPAAAATFAPSADALLGRFRALVPGATALEALAPLSAASNRREASPLTGRRAAAVGLLGSGLAADATEMSYAVVQCALPLFLCPPPPPILFLPAAAAAFAPSRPRQHSSDPTGFEPAAAPFLAHPMTPLDFSVH
ncbi:hypothetical protein B0H11DRAFT_2255832 [Mycena galericulata]|nr:hypothetical protein B0H11DRAFT_2255832 [Mycena galericulata]